MFRLSLRAERSNLPVTIRRLLRRTAKVVLQTILLLCSSQRQVAQIRLHCHYTGRCYNASHESATSFDVYLRASRRRIARHGRHAGEVRRRRRRDILAYGDAHGCAPHRVSKLYYKVWTQSELAAYQSVLGDQVMRVDGMDRRPVGWNDWAITTRVDTTAHWRTVWRAVACHRSQLPTYSKLAEEHHRGLWSSQGFYRAFSLVNGGRTVEDDLFAGLR